jgi:hypothetical protein
MALRAAITIRVAVKVRGISRMTSSGVLSSFICFIEDRLSYSTRLWLLF